MNSEPFQNLDGIASGDPVDIQVAPDRPLTVTLSIKVRQRRLDHMLAHAKAVLRRAPKRDRQALGARLALNMAQQCFLAQVKA